MQTIRTETVLAPTELTIRTMPVQRNKSITQVYGLTDTLESTASPKMPWIMTTEYTQERVLARVRSIRQRYCPGPESLLNLSNLLRSRRVAERMESSQRKCWQRLKQIRLLEKSVQSGFKTSLRDTLLGVKTSIMKIPTTRHSCFGNHPR